MLWIRSATATLAVRATPTNPSPTLVPAPTNPYPTLIPAPTLSLNLTQPQTPHSNPNLFATLIPPPNLTLTPRNPYPTQPGESYYDILARLDPLVHEMQSYP